jgi:hypothetical protein
MLRLARPQRGFTLFETTAAIGLTGAFIAVLIVISSTVLSLVRTSKDNISAGQALQERVEKLRLVTWNTLTDAALLAPGVLGQPSASVAGLAAPVETITIRPYPDKPSFTPVTVVRQNGATTVVSSNAALENERLVRVDCTLAWKGYPQKRNRTRTSTVLIAKKNTVP